MVKKENVSYAGNSLLQTASNKRLGAGRFALLALRGNPKPPLKKVKVPLPRPNHNNNSNNNAKNGNVDTTDDRSKISDMTISVGESSLLSRPALIKEVQVHDDIDIESSVLEMSVNSGINSADFAFRRDYEPRNGGANATTTGLSTRQPSARNPFANIGTSVKTPIQPKNAIAYQQHPSNKTVSQSLSHPKGATVKRNMILNKGIMLSAPSPMTLNRFELQLGREHVAPESKEYLEEQATKKKERQKQIEKDHLRQAKKAVKEELKREFQREQGEGFEAQLEDNFEDTTGLKKKSLVKKILGKFRPSSPNKKTEQQKLHEQEGSTLDKQSATAMARRALLKSKQKTGLGMGTLDYPIAVASPQNGRMSSNFVGSSAGDAAAIAAAAATADMEMGTESVPFPVDEILMQQKQDSVSDLDASFRQMPMMEIRMGSRDPQSRDDESVSTLGTPRVFQKLDNLLRDSNPDPPEVARADSMPPPPMVLSQDANPLIDQLESGERSEGTAAVEKNASLCAGCVMDPQRPAGTLRSTVNNKKLPTVKDRDGKNDKVDTTASILARVEEVGDGGIETHLDVTHSSKDFLLGEKPMFDEVQVSSRKTDISHAGETHKSAFSAALDQAIQEASAQPNREAEPLFPDVHLQTALSPIEEGEEVISPKTGLLSTDKRPYVEGQLGEKNLNEDLVVIDLTKQPLQQSSSQPANFENLMDIAARKLVEKRDDRYAVEDEDDRYTSSDPFEGGLSKQAKIEEHPKQILMGHHVNESSMDDAPVVPGTDVSSPGIRATDDLVTPRTRGGTKPPLFDLNKTTSSGSSGDLVVYEDDGGEIVICSDDPNKLPHGLQHKSLGSPESNLGKCGEEKPAENLESNFSDGLFDLLPSVPENTGEAAQSQENEKTWKLQSVNTEKITVEKPDITAIKSDQHVLDRVFEYSDIVLCGKSSQNTIRRTTEDMSAGQKESKKNVFCGGAPLFFSTGGKKEEEKSTIALPHSETGVSKELVKAKLPSIPAENQLEDIVNIEPNVPAKGDAVDRDAEEGKFLLDHDDAYWDTLSTIASTTKDKSSSDSEKYMYDAAIPGPIPEEITMAMKDPGAMTRNGLNDEAATRATNTIDHLMKENYSTPKARTERQTPDLIQDVGKTMTGGDSKVQRLSRMGSVLSGDEELLSPPVRELKNDEEETGSGNSKVADLIAVFENTSTGSETPGAKASREGSALLLSVTRSESAENEHSNDAPEGTSTTRDQSRTNQKAKVTEKPCPETGMEASRKSKQTFKSNRSVSWGFEEIYENRDHKSSQKNLQFGKNDEIHLQDSNGDKFLSIPIGEERAVLSAIAAAAEGSAVTNGLERSPKDKSLNDQKLLSDSEEQNLFARTLELSRDLFGSLTSQDLKGDDEEVVKSIFAFGMPFSSRQNEKDSQENLQIQSPTSVKGGNGASEHSPIDVESLRESIEGNNNIILGEKSVISRHHVVKDNQENSGRLENQRLDPRVQQPVVRTKLDILREQRTRALERFQLAKPSSPSLVGHSRSEEFQKRRSLGELPFQLRDRDRLKHYTPSQDHLRATIAKRPHSTDRTRFNRFSDDEKDLENSSTTSSASAPSQKARELRRQLDNALKASKEIKMSQDQLGNELRSFKSRYYMKNDEIEDHALRAIAGP